jgi:hypothetical protein
MLTLLGAARAQAQLPSDVVGTWRFVSETREENGMKKDVRRNGRLVLDPNGNYVLTLMGVGLPKIASNNRTTATPEEAKAIVGESVSHFGTYRVAGDALVFKVENATFANWDGAEQKRPYTVNGDELKYSLAVGSGGGRLTLNWVRVK